MKHILLCHDGANLQEEAMHCLQKALHNASTLDILYVIPQNLVHYGQVDQLATPDSKYEFIDYVQELGIKECKEKLGLFAEEIKNFIKMQGLYVDVKMHVRWGSAQEAILEVVKSYNHSVVLLPSKVWSIDWHLQKNVQALTGKLSKKLQII